MNEPDQFFHFMDNTIGSRGYTWAISIVPRSGMVDWVCPDCGAIHRYPSGAFDVIVEGGTKYPDVLGCGAFPCLIVSERVVDVWMAAGIYAFHTYPVQIAAVHSKKLTGVAQLGYHRVEIDGRCEIDLAASGLVVARRCPRCNALATRPSRAEGFKVVSGSWDRNHVFRDANLFPGMNFCTHLVLDLARKYRLTNFRFEPMQGPFDLASRGIDYLKGDR